ncbi:MAG: phage late control D family protein, partial [Saprospiraceae bacterium]
AWYPTKGDTLDVQAGYDDFLLPCGKFTIDEIGLSGPPNVVSIRGLATGPEIAMRTRNNSAHENKTLREIANTIAGKHGLTVQGDIEEIRINRATQHRETDLAFLKRISWQYGHVFSVRAGTMVFTTIYQLEGADAISTIDVSDLIRYSLTDKTAETYKAAEVKYHDPVEKKVIRHTENAAESDTAGDTLVLQCKAENPTQARAQAKAALYRANTRRQSGSITVPGNPLLVAGNSFTLTGLGALDGKYHITESSHSLSRSGGYVTDLSIKKV